MKLFLTTLFFLILYNQSWASIFEVVDKGDIKKLKVLIIENKIDVNIKNKKGQTPLFKIHNLEIVNFLIKHGADVNAESTRGETPLHYSMDKPKITKVLIENGANVNAKINSSFNIKINGEITNVLENFTPLHLAVMNDNIETAKLLIEHGADVNTTDAVYTPLYEVRSLQMIKLLIENGANVLHTNRFGTTPLHLARTAQIAKVLIENGADVNAESYGETTPLHSLLGKGPELVKTLIKAGADVNVRSGGVSPLHMVVQIPYTYKEKREASFETAKILIEAGADVNAKDNQGNLPIHYVENFKTAKLLCDNGSDLSFIDIMKTTKNKIVGSIFSYLVLTDEEIHFNKNKIDSYN